MYFNDGRNMSIIIKDINNLFNIVMFKEIVTFKIREMEKPLTKPKFYLIDQIIIFYGI